MHFVLIPLFTLIGVIYSWPLMNANKLNLSIPWFREFGINFSFRIDSLSWLFCLIISLVSTAVFTYAVGYFKGTTKGPKFWTYIILFYLSMLGIVVSDDLILMFIFWELTSVSSYMLIGFYHEKKESRDSSLTALLVTGGGGLALLGGIVLLGTIGNTFSISELVQNKETLLSSPYITAVLILFILGAFTKSAQWPFHFWLPGAMSAPAPVSSLLHSATMVKAGVYLMLRMFPLFSDMELFRTILIICGGMTMTYGAFLSLTYSDMKKILANTTISGLGILIMLIGIGTPKAIEGAMIFFIVHALYKSSLFMCTGTLDKCSKSRDINVLSGLKSDFPLVYIASILAALSMGGIPFFIGFLGKEIIYEALIKGDTLVVYSTVLAIITNAFTFAVGFIVALKPFRGEKLNILTDIKKANKLLTIPPLILGFLGLGIGTFYPFLNGLITPIHNQFLNLNQDLNIAIWHGINTPLMMSLGTVLIGILFYKNFHLFQNIGRFLSKYEQFSGANLFLKGMEKLIAFSKFQTSFFQSGKIRHYVFTIFLVTSLCLLFIITTQKTAIKFDFTGLLYFEVFIGLTMAVSAVSAVFTNSKLAGAIELGALGVGITLFFAFYSGPDLAMTQVLVEALTVILFVLVIYKLPKPKNLSSKFHHIKDILLSVSFGCLMAGVTYKSSEVKLSPSISNFFKEVSLSEAFGKNIVNVILVDFRGLDTLGEGLVLGLAAMGIFVLLKFKDKKGQQE